ncbi:hypothetical protein SD71_00430 [Cohnella kolymensis]|uniref:Uncharacterized protein n=1 Tax=Cohnella kolymensis TaxID=1590652 RepID=A0ABR5A883_9BACL|nr:hypothetical protein SD71_00430 [Cohnella kolymensis]
MWGYVQFTQERKKDGYVQLYSGVRKNEGYLMGMCTLLKVAGERGYTQERKKDGYVHFHFTQVAENKDISGMCTSLRSGETRILMGMFGLAGMGK